MLVDLGLGDLPVQGAPWCQDGLADPRGEGSLRPVEGVVYVHDESGRDLLLVEALATAWGCQP